MSEIQKGLSSGAWRKIHALLKKCSAVVFARRSSPVVWPLISSSVTSRISSPPSMPRSASTRMMPVLRLRIRSRTACTRSCCTAAKSDSVTRSSLVSCAIDCRSRIPPITLAPLPSSAPWNYSADCGSPSLSTIHEVVKPALPCDSGQRRAALTLAPSAPALVLFATIMVPVSPLGLAAAVRALRIGVLSKQFGYRRRRNDKCAI